MRMYNDPLVWDMNKRRGFAAFGGEPRSYKSAHRDCLDFIMGPDKHRKNIPSEHF